MSKLIPLSEVEKHNKPNDLWCIINGRVLDLTEFAPNHPGGAKIIEDVAGKECTEEFKAAHSDNYKIITLTMGPDAEKKATVGNIDPATLPAIVKGAKAKVAHAEVNMDYSLVPPLEAVLNVHDFEHISKKKLIANGKKQAYDYYSSGADDELTYQENVNAFQRIWLKPRILVNVKNIDYKCKILGQHSSFPVYLSAVAMCGMGHEDGECSWMKAAAAEDVTFMIPNLSSKSFESILASRTGKQPTWLQIYVNPSKEVVLDQIRACEANGVQALAITVDSAVPGKRERDQRNKIAVQLGQQKMAEAAAKGTTARKAGVYANRDPGLHWDDVKWFQQNTKLPLILKGVQCGEDAVMAAKCGCHAIILSNHGGRNLDTSRSGIEVLPEVVDALKEAKLFGTIEIYVDGGIRRGTDILKAIALGANAVGLGKPAVYSMSAYGDAGIARMLQILKDELTQAMQLVGVTRLTDLSPKHLNYKDLDNHSATTVKAENPWQERQIMATTQDKSVTAAPKSVTEIKAEIIKLQAELQLAEGFQAKPSSIHIAYVTLIAVSKSIAMSVFSTDAGVALHRSAIFLILYVLTHMLTNASVFWSTADDWNQVLHAVTHSLPYKAFEIYLALSFLVHGGIGSFNSFKKQKFIISNLPVNGRLMISGVALTMFLYVHVTSLRFGSTEGYMTKHASPMRDYYKQTKDHLADPVTLGIYLVGIAGLWVHLFVGWGKTVHKLDVSKEMKSYVTDFGNLVATLICLGFVSVAVYFHLMAHGEYGLL